MLSKLLNFKTLIQDKLHGYNLCILSTKLRSNDGKATLVVNHLTHHELQLNIDIVDNRNINSKHLILKGFHLNESWSQCLAINFKDILRNFCEKM